MSSESLEALQKAGILGNEITGQLKTFVSSLSAEETSVLIALKNRLMAGAQDGEVQAHSLEWTKPEIGQEGVESPMDCLCGAWSGSGSGKE